MLTHRSISDYMSGLAQANKNLNSFFRFNLADIQSAIRSGITFPALALESPEGNFQGSGITNSQDNKKFAFTIFDKPKRNDFEDEDTKLDNCEKYGKQVLARMRYDARVPGNILHNIFKLEKVEYHKVGPLFSDALFGYRFEVDLDSIKTDMKIDPEDWNDLDSPCP